MNYTTDLTHLEARQLNHWIPKSVRYMARSEGDCNLQSKEGELVSDFPWPKAIKKDALSC